MSKEYVQHFHQLTLALLTDKEREDLHKSLRHYQRTNDIPKLAKTIKKLLNTPERSKLLAYIRAPMSKAEKNQFDVLLGIHSHGSIETSYPQRPGFLGRITTPSGSVTSSERHVTIYGSRGGSMGFSIRGGSEFGLGIYISNVRPGSPAADAGLQIGDHVLAANGVDFQCVANSSAVKVLSSSALLNLVIVRCRKVPEWKVARERILWFDVSLCRIVATPPVTEIHSAGAQSNVLVERKLVISVIQDTDYIGLNVRGGKEYGTGIYVSRIDAGGLASRVGLSPGDQIVKVNNTDFLSVTHSDAVDALRASTHLIIAIRSVGKYPVFKELYAEYTWSDATGLGNINSVRGHNQLITAPGDKSGAASRKHTYRTRARESSIDLSPYDNLKGNNRNNFNESDLDDIDDIIEELDDGLEVETRSRVCVPGDKDIMFRKNYEDSWKEIDTLNDNYARHDDQVKSWSVDNLDSLGHYRQDSDVDDHPLDYTTFLEQNTLRKQLETTLPNQQQAITVTNVNRTENVVIETYVEEVTSFGATPTKRISKDSASDVFMADETETDVNYSQATTLKSSDRGENLARSSTSSSVAEVPIYATVNKKANNSRTSSIKSTRAPDVPPGPPLAVVNGLDGDVNDEELEVLSSQIQQLEARKSNLGSWEINRVTGAPVSPPTSPDLSAKSDNSQGKNKGGTWSSLKKKVKGSLSRKFAAQKQRSSIPSADAYSGSKTSTPSGSLRQKGLFERSFGSQILNSPNSERYNLMGMLEDHARRILAEDECKAVLRHIHNYHENKDLERLVELLLVILDKPDKRMLLVDVRNVIAPSHIERFDRKIEQYNVQGYDKWMTKYNIPENDANTGDVPSPPIKPARTTNGVHSKSRSRAYEVNGGYEDSYTSRIHSFSKADFESSPDHYEVVIFEKDELENGETARLQEGEEVVYISKHKNLLGLEICGGKNDPHDQAIRVSDVMPGSAASDDKRLRPGVEITGVNGKSVVGLSQQEVESMLQVAFSVKTPVNLGILIRQPLSHL